MLAIKHWSECNLWSGAPQKHSSRSREHLSVRIDFSDAPPKASGNSSCSRWAGGMHSCPQPSQKSSGFFKQAKKKKKKNPTKIMRMPSSTNKRMDTYSQLHTQKPGHPSPLVYCREFRHTSSLERLGSEVRKLKGKASSSTRYCARYSLNMHFY